MDINDKILKLYQGFINDIIRVFPEHEEIINKNYKEILELNELNLEENIIIKDFLKIIDNYSNDITNKNETIFLEDKICIIKDISMKDIWSSNISDKTKNNIWKYLQSFCLINISINSNDKINEVLKSIDSKEKVTDKETLKDIKKIKKINENIKKEDNNKKDKDNDLNNVENILNNTGIGSLAKEITEDLNLEDMDEQGMENFMKPENMMNIFQKINSTLTSKMENNELDGNALLGEASNLMNNNDMMGNMMNMFKNMGGSDNNNRDSATPDLSGMMNMFQNMNGQQQQTQDNNINFENSSIHDNPEQHNNKSDHDGSEVKERLRKKLDKKKLNKK